jgi:hypothetical protein
VTLENGDTLPAIIQQRPIESILKPYTTADNKVQIGIHDLLILVGGWPNQPKLTPTSISRM